MASFDIKTEKGGREKGVDPQEMVAGTIYKCRGFGNEGRYLRFQNILIAFDPNSSVNGIRAYDINNRSFWTGGLNLITAPEQSISIQFE